MTNVSGITEVTTATLERPSDRDLQGQPPTRGLAKTCGRSGRGHVARLGWALAGVMVTVLTLGWVFLLAPHALVEGGALDRPMTSWLDPAVYAAAFVVWG